MRVPNEETVEAIEASERGEVDTARTVVEMTVKLNVDVLGNAPPRAEKNPTQRDESNRRGSPCDNYVRHP